MKIHLIGVASILTLAMLGSSGCDTPKPQTTLEVVEAKWIPPQTKIDPAYVEAGRRLLGNGLADPRAGTFCVEKTADQDLQARPMALERYGWVSSDRKWLNGLDGVISPIHGDIHPANLELVVNDLMRKPKPPRFSSEHSDLSPATIAVLLVAGRPGLAEQISFPEFYGQSPEASLTEYLALRYEAMADTDLEQRKDQDGLSAASYWVRVLRIQAGTEKPAGPPTQTRMPTNSRGTELAKATNLFNDFQRRVAGQETQTYDPKSLTGLDKQTRIAKLIEALAGETPMISNPGGADWIGDPVCQALATEGADAIPPLIDALERDKRLTRGVFRRTFSETAPGAPITVHSAEWTAIQMIWPTAVRYANTNPGESPDPATLKAAWAKEGSVPDAQRWLNVLEDDRAESRLWVDAAENLVKPSNEIRVGWSRMTPAAKAPMTGEPLRALQGAAISALLAKRAEQVAAPTAQNAQGLFGAGSALRIAHLSYRWSRPDSLSCLQAVCRSIVSELPSFDREGNLKDNLGDPFGVAIADRLTLKDASAVQDYAAFVPYVKPEIWFTSPGFFRPLWTVPINEAVQQIGTRYMKSWSAKFASPDPKVWRSSLDCAVGTLASSSIIQFRPYRQLLIEAIETKTAGGESEIVQMGDRKFAACKIGGQAVTNWNIPQGSEADYETGNKSTFSVGDYAAQSLVQFVKGIPPFFASLPGPKRGEARKAIVNWLSDDKRDWEAVARSSPFYSIGQD